MKTGTETSTEIEKLIGPTLSDLGYDLVLARMIGGARRTLQVMAEPVDRDRSMTVADCASISHAVSAVLDVADPVAGRYTLEVSSPGIDRPLVRQEDFRRFAGHVARVELDEAVGGQRRFKGRLVGILDDGRVRLETEEGQIDVPLERIRKAKLELTDELIKAAGKAASGPAGGPGDGTDRHAGG